MKKFLLFFALLGSLKIAKSQSGLDPAFGTGGIVKADLGTRFSYNSQARQVLVQPNGNIYIALTGAFDGTIFSKRLADGSIDSSYGVNGFSTKIPGSFAMATLQADGRIIAVGSSVARLKTNGTLDSAFGSQGILLPVFTPRAAAVQADGKIVVAGGSTEQGFTLTRLNGDGTSDNSFNGGAILQTNFIYKVPPDRGGDSVEMISGTANAVAIQADGKILVGGSAKAEPIFYLFAVARYNTDGSLDLSFDGDGLQTTPINGSNSFGNALALQGDGKIIMAGSTDGGASMVARFNTDGALDASFNGGGTQTVPVATDMLTASPIVVLSNGKIIVSGYSNNGTDNDFAVASLNTDGSADSNFGTDGLVVTDLNSTDDYSGSVALESNGRILVAGYATALNGLQRFALTRYTDAGVLDNSLNMTGKLIGDLNQGSTNYNAVAVQSNGKSVVVGHTWNGEDYDFVVARYNTNGSFDNTFNGNGRQTSDFGVDDEAVSVAIQPDGKIVVGGTSLDLASGVYQFLIARYNTNGSLDNTFSSDGKLSFSIGTSSALKGIALQPDGKILLTGVSYPNLDSSYFAVARLNANGTLDNTFSADGEQLIEFGASINEAASVAIQNNGKIVVAGRIFSNGQDYGAIARLNSDGTLDATFSQDGRQTNSFGADNYFFRALAIQNDGKVVATGYSDNSSGGNTSFILARYQSNGNLDSTFGINGFTSNSPGTSFNFGNSVAISSDGRIAVGGTNDNYTIILYKANGTPDSTFGTNGTLITAAGLVSSAAMQLAFFEDKLYAAGSGLYPGSFGILARFTLSEGGSLPVTLLDFNAVLQNKITQLTWKVATQDNLAGFGIERSTDGLNFNNIGHVAAKLSNGVQLSYGTTDDHPMFGLNYYRLKMIDLDGKFKYSPIVAVNLKDQLFSLKIFPNPVQDMLFINTNGNNETANFRLIDANGKMVKQIAVPLNGNTAFSVSVSNLAKGVYSLQLVTKTTTETRQFIKQ